MARTKAYRRSAPCHPFLQHEKSLVKEKFYYIRPQKKRKIQDDEPYWTKFDEIVQQLFQGNQDTILQSLSQHDSNLHRGGFVSNGLQCYERMVDAEIHLLFKQSRK
jgi:hypothetical protein